MQMEQKKILHQLLVALKNIVILEMMLTNEWKINGNRIGVE